MLNASYLEIYDSILSNEKQRKREKERTDCSSIFIFFRDVRKQRPILGLYCAARRLVRFLAGDDRRPRRGTRDKEESVARQIRVRKFAGESGSLRKLESRARRTRANGNLCDTRGGRPSLYFFAASWRRFVAGATITRSSPADGMHGQSRRDLLARLKFTRKGEGEGERVVESTTSTSHANDEAIIASIWPMSCHVLVVNSRGGCAGGKRTKLW